MDPFSQQFGQSFGSLSSMLQGFLEDLSGGGAQGLFQTVLNRQGGGAQSPMARFFGPQFGTFVNQYLGSMVQNMLGGGGDAGGGTFSDFITGQNFGNLFGSYSPRERGQNPGAFQPLTQKLR